MALVLLYGKYFLLDVIVNKYVLTEYRHKRDAKHVLKLSTGYKKHFLFPLVGETPIKA